MAEREPLKCYTAEEVAQHASMDDAWAIVDGFVYDITSCMQNGRHTLPIVSRDLGRDISFIFKQIHSRNARNMLPQPRIGVLAGSPSRNAPSEPIAAPARAPKTQHAPKLVVTPPSAQCTPPHQP